jgi:hypothetical protein
MLPPNHVAQLEADGFTGFVTIGQLHRDGCRVVPDARGVYVVLARSEAPHPFLERSSAPEWRGMSPSLPRDELRARWVEGATLLYVGRACGPGVRHRLRQRIKRYLRFGHGKVVAHWDGRHIWQLGEPSRLVMAWRVSDADDDPAARAAGLLAAFERHYGRLPFANPALEEDGVDEGDPDGEDSNS